MKVRKFYPAQVLRKLQGDHADLSAEQAAALRYLTLKSRQLGLSVVVGPVGAYKCPQASVKGRDDAEGSLLRVRIFGGNRGFTDLPEMKDEAMR